MVATSRLCLSELLCSTFSNCGIVIFDHVLYASEVCTCFSFFFDVLKDFSGTLGGHVPVVGPVKCGFSVSLDLSASKISS